MSRPARTKRVQKVTALSHDDVRVLIKGEYYFDGSVEDLEPKWRRYRKELMKEHSRPGFRPHAWWILDMRVTDLWLQWKENVPLAERRKYRTKNGKVLSNREYSNLLI